MINVDEPYTTICCRLTYCAMSVTIISLTPSQRDTYCVRSLRYVCYVTRAYLILTSQVHVWYVSDACKCYVTTIISCELLYSIVMCYSCNKLVFISHRATLSNPLVAYIWSCNQVPVHQYYRISRSHITSCKHWEM